MQKEISFDSLLSKYPKDRYVLNEKEKALYKQEYLGNRLGSTLFTKISQFLESWMHKQVAKSAKRNQDTLEIGAGTLNQIPYELESVIFNNFDVIEPQSYLFENAPNKQYLRRIFHDISEIPEDQTYDRIISIAVLEHLTDLPFIIAKSGLLLNNNGVFHHGIPNEGGLLWGMAWRFTTGLSYKLRTGCSYKNLMKHEHVNSAMEILSCLKLFFEKVEVKKFPTPFNHLSLYVCIRCENPKKALCREYLMNAKRISGK